MKISENGLNLIKKFEGLSLKPYLCSAGIPTIGYGNTFYKNMTKVTMKDNPITEDEADSLFNFLVTTNFVNVVNRLVIVDINQNQFDALVSFVYNLGSGNFEKSTLLKKVNQEDFIGASLEFEKWNRAGGKVLNGLTKRRLAEKELFLS
jgi:lysozyme